MDTIGLSFPIEKAILEPETAAVCYTKAGEEWRYRRHLPSGGVISWGLAERAWVEASLPKRLSGENIGGLEIENVGGVLEDLWGEASEVVEPSGKLGEAKITRLDLVRDFDDVGSLTELAMGLSRVKQPGRALVSVVHDGDLSGALTLRIGTKTSWLGRTYDKHHETKGQAPVGRVRFEAQLRKEALQSVWAKDLGKVLRYAGHLEEVDARLTAAALTRGMWERCGMDRKVCSSSKAAKVIGGARGLSEAEKYGLLGYLTGRAAGWSCHLHRHTVRKYEKLAKGLGIVMQAADVETLAYSVRLDFDSGREVLEVG